MVICLMSHSPLLIFKSVPGQDGSYLTELLLSKGYIVHGIIRRSSSFNTGRLEHIYEDFHSTKARLFLHFGDLSDSSNLTHIISTVKPDEVYNLAAQSHVMVSLLCFPVRYACNFADTGPQVSFEMSEYTADVDAVGTLRILNAIRSANLEKHTKFYQASTSELYGKVQEIPQTEKTPFYPRSPYGKYCIA